ncbi:hypothetical protein ACMATS_26385 [Streptoverticillium reticulum]|uniref:hypothetical protein n=1 Tax=Streptoverticillium reticulum TaxID=1433415 RepID=UPI0039BF12F7
MTSGDLIGMTGFHLTFTPVLTPSGRAGVSAMGKLTGCVSPNGLHSELLSGVISATGKAEAHPVDSRPLGALRSAGGKGTIMWSPTRARSRFSWSMSISPVKAEIAFSATITGGKLNGDTVMAGPVLARVKPGLGDRGLGGLSTDLAVVVFG